MMQMFSSFRMFLQSRLVKRYGRIDTEARTLMGDHVRHIVSIKQSVDVDTVTAAHRGLL